LNNKMLNILKQINIKSLCAILYNTSMLFYPVRQCWQIIGEISIVFALIQHSKYYVSYCLRKRKSVGRRRNVYEITTKFHYVTAGVMLRLSWCYMCSDIIFMITYPMVIGIAEGDYLQCYGIWVWHNCKTHHSMLIPMSVNRRCSLHTSEPPFFVWTFSQRTAVQTKHAHVMFLRDVSLGTSTILQLPACLICINTDFLLKWILVCLTVYSATKCTVETLELLSPGI